MSKLPKAALLLAGVLTIGMAACGSDAKSVDTTAAPTTVATTTAPAATAVATTTAAPQATGGDINACRAIETAVNDAAADAATWTTGVSAAGFHETQQQLDKAVIAAADDIDTASLAITTAALANQVHIDLMDVFAADQDRFFNSAVGEWMSNVDGDAGDVANSCRLLGFAITPDKLIR
jgi:isochorismate synthase EntC